MEGARAYCSTECVSVRPPPPGLFTALQGQRWATPALTVDFWVN